MKLKLTEGHLISITSFADAVGLQTIEKSCLERMCVTYSLHAVCLVFSRYAMYAVVRCENGVSFSPAKGQSERILEGV